MFEPRTTHDLPARVAEKRPAVNAGPVNRDPLPQDELYRIALFQRELSPQEREARYRAMRERRFPQGFVWHSCPRHPGREFPFDASDCYGGCPECNAYRSGSNLSLPGVMACCVEEYRANRWYRLFVWAILSLAGSFVAGYCLFPTLAR